MSDRNNCYKQHFNATLLHSLLAIDDVMNISDDDDKDSIMRQERTSRCGWEVLTRRSQPNNPEDDDDDAGTAPGSPNIRVSEILNIFYEIFSN